MTDRAAKLAAAKERLADMTRRLEDLEVKTQVSEHEHSVHLREVEALHEDAEHGHFQQIRQLEAAHEEQIHQLEASHHEQIIELEASRLALDRDRVARLRELETANQVTSPDTAACMA